MDDREKFLAERMSGIGGSDIGSVLHMNPWKSARELWLEKIGEVDNDISGPLLEKGHVLEPIAAEKYMEQTGRKVQRRNKCYRHPEADYLLAHIDRLIVNDDRGPGVLEIKCPQSFAFKKYSETGLPDFYVLQLQHYLLCTGYTWGAFCLFNADQWEICHYDITPEPAIHEMILEEGEKFWRCVDTRTEPASLEQKKISMPKVGDCKITEMESDEWSEAVEQLKQAKDMINDAKMLEDIAKQKIIDLMDGNEICEGAECRAYYRESKGRVTVDTKRLKAEKPEIYEEFQKVGKPVLSLKTYFKK
jgi:putative phage-type endonuclease